MYTKYSTFDYLDDMLRIRGVIELKNIRAPIWGILEVTKKITSFCLRGP